MHFKRDDKIAGEFLNEKLAQFSETDYKTFECYYIGKPNIAVAFWELGETNLGIIGEAAIAAEDFTFTKKTIKSILDLFFPKKYNRIRLQALISPDNGQAIRLIRLCGFTYEGRMRKVAKDGDRLIFAILKEEYEQLIQKP